MIVGTAGHIDHGKTTLVRCLTGIDTDRLPEEKARGITIDLGFAHLDVGGRRLGIVDVPGHERFVRTMAAGAGGVEVVMLVVAADEGVMPQTREHIDVCELLGARAALIVLTKCDLVDDDWVDLVEEDVRSAVAGTIFEEAPMCRFGAPKGEPVRGLDGVLGALAAATDLPQDDRVIRPLRMPVDRVFTMKGFGTVVTGTLLTGSVSVGDAVTMLPSGRVDKVRGLQVHGEAVERAEAGSRTAVNLQGVDRHEADRGHVLTRSGEMTTTMSLDVVVTWLPHMLRPLKHRGRVLFLVGTGFARAQITLADVDVLEPGAKTLAQVRLDRPVVALPGDGFILRGFATTAGHGRTVGGGRVLAIRPPKRRKGRTGDWVAPRALAERGEEGAVEVLVRQAGSSGLDRAELTARTGWSSKDLDGRIRALLGAGGALRFDKERDALVHADTFAVLGRRATALLGAYHEAHPRASGMAREELRSRLGEGVPAKLFHLLVRRLETEGALAGDREVVRLGTFSPRDDAALERLKGAVLDVHLQAGPTPPRMRELAERLRVPDAAVTDAVRELEEAGDLVRIRDDIYLAAQALSDLRGRLVEYLSAHGRIDTAAFKEMVGGSRKYVIPLAEHFDKERLTLRVGDERVLRGRTPAQGGG